jgi:hypothetical protein
MATMNGWSWELTKFYSGYPRPSWLSPHQVTQFPFFHANLTCRRIKSGCRYQLAIVANDTWRFLDKDDSSSTMPQVTTKQNESPVRNPDSSTTSFYAKIYDALVRDESMRTDVDRKLALAVREACQSHCSRVERDAVAVFTDISHLHLKIAPGSLSRRLYCKYAIIIFERAAKELSRLEADMRAEKQKKHELLMAKKAEKAAKDAKDKQDMAKMAEKKLQIDVSSNLALQQRASRSGFKSDGTEDEFEELTRMMAEWHL